MDDIAVGREQARALGAALHRTGIKVHELWLQSFRFGGETGEMEIQAYLHHCLRLPPFHRDLLAHAANTLIDQLPPPRAPYSTELTDPARPV
ncbi:hypothetical protein GCM10009696_37000 [Kocuria himachalensis]